MKPDKAVLLLEDGTTFEGRPFGHVGETVGEAVFYTGVVGYQEVITDPSYRGTILVCTYPIIGSYGVNSEDNESPSVHTRGIVVKEYSPYFSNFRATGSLEDFLKAHGVVGIHGVDTRAVAVHLRDHGEMKGLIASGKYDCGKLLKKLKEMPSPFADDLLKDLPADEAPKPAASGAHRVAALNIGITRGLLAQLADLDCRVDILPATASAEDVLAKKPRGLLLAGGPGDPTVPGYAVETVKSLLGRLPILGIGLGHHLLALGLGCKVKRMKAGHRGVNYPVRDIIHKNCRITVQHHSFVVDKDSVPASVEVTHENVNDGTVEGIRGRELDASSVQFHPCRDEMGRPSKVLEGFVAGK